MKEIVMERIVELLESSVGTGIIFAAGLALFFTGMVMFIYIVYNGKVPILDSVFKNKIIHNDLFKKLYKIQAIYTAIAGILLMIFVFIDGVDRMTTVYVFLGFGLIDLLYDIFAIKRSSKAINE